MKFRFNSYVVFDENNKLANYSENDVKNEPMLFSCDYQNAINLGGPITRNFIAKIPLHILQKPDFVIDTRVHMLMPNWYSSIPGFHHDDIPCSSPDGQPNYHTPEYDSEHVMCLVNGDICPTLFAIGESDFEDIPPGEKYYKVWHKEVESKLRDGVLQPWSAPTNIPIYFNCHAWHTGTPAVRGGWRYFARASWNTHRKHFNEVRRQVQVYLAQPMEGW